MRSLLPPNSAPLVHALEDVAAERIDAIPVPLRELWDPWVCPLALLPWLAWALSVDEWGDAWPESAKRQVVAESIQVHLHKGTRGSVQDALAALGVTVDLTEWFEQSPPGERGTMRLTAWVKQILTSEDAVLTARLYAQLKRAVDALKRGSIHYDLRVGAAFENGLGIASVMAGSQVAQQDAAVIQAPLASLVTMGVAASASGVSVARFSMQAV